MVELVILLFVVLAVACFGLLLPFLRLAVGIVLLVVRLLAALWGCISVWTSNLVRLTDKSAVP